MKVNYKSDFDFIFAVKDCKGEDIGFPDFDWKAKFYTSKMTSYVVSSIGGVLTNCFNDEGKIHCVFNSHNMAVGKLSVGFYAHLPNENYPDGTKDIFTPMTTDVELVNGCGDCDAESDIDVVLNAFKGDKGDKGDDGISVTEVEQTKTSTADSDTNIFTITLSNGEKADFTVRNGSKGSKGDKGDQGQQGIQGIKGEKGDKGDAFTYEDFTEDEILSLQKPAIEAATSADAAAISAYQAINDMQSEFAKKQDKLTTTEDLDISEENVLGLTDMASKRWLIDYWNTFSILDGKYNASTGYFELNGLKDITYEQALRIYAAGTVRNSTPDTFYQGMSIRTHLPSRVVYSIREGGWTFFGSSVEVINTRLLYCGVAFCNDCKNLVSMTVWALNYNANLNIAVNCENLTTINVSHMYANSFSLAWSPKITLSSFQKMVTLYDDSKAITITVHPDVYAKLTDEANAEWNALLNEAAEKSISFATV